MGIQEKDLLLYDSSLTPPPPSTTPPPPPTEILYTSVIGDKRYELTNHLGNVLSVISDKKLVDTQNSTIFKPEVLSYSDYEPFGMLMPNRHGQSDSYRYGFNGKELDNEIKGDGNSYDFGARMLDVRIGRWFARDPLESKYPNLTTYHFSSDNPIIYYDFNGEDIVYFNRNGDEIKRVVTDKVFKTYVFSSVVKNVVTSILGQTPSFADLFFEEVPMPGIIKGYEDPKYQKLDYQIAASTGLLNMSLAEKEGNPAVENHQVTDKTQNPRIDVNLVKAIVMQESKMGTDQAGNGTAETDPMQSNYKGDFDASKDVKIAAGLTKGQSMNPKTSIDAGLKIFYLKGMSSDKKGNYTKWKGDEVAVEKYNGGGTEGYGKSVMNMYKSISNKPKSATVPKSKARILKSSEL